MYYIPIDIATCMWTMVEDTVVHVNLFSAHSDKFYLDFFTRKLTALHAKKWSEFRPNLALEDMVMLS